MMKKILVGLAVMTTATCAFGQSLKESVTVEGRFTPEIISADRLALLPSTMQLTAPESPMAYDRAGVIANFAPDALNLPATGWRAMKLCDTSRGYIDFRLGSWLNASLYAGYSAIQNPDTRLNIYLQHHSTSLWQAWKEDAATGTPAADKRYRYDEIIGAELQHKLLGLGTLTADLRYHLGYFNYYGTLDSSELMNGHLKVPNQTLNDLYAHVGWLGTGNDRLSYTADADVRYFGYRDCIMELPSFSSSYPAPTGEFITTDGERETAINVGGDINYHLDDEKGNGSAVGIALRYSGVINHLWNDVNRIEAKPAYTLTGKGYSLRLGANLAVVGNEESTRFRAAPDVSFSVRNGNAAFLATIGGGTHLRTLAWHYFMDYYSNPSNGCYDAAYSPLDARLAFQLNPGGKWTVGIEGEWRTTLDESFGGLYQAFLNENLDKYGDYRLYGKIHGYSIGINAGYEFCQYLTLNGHAAWQPQDGVKGFLNGFDRPEFTAELGAISKPIDKLTLNLNYQLRAKRLLLPGNISRLDLSGEYKITDKLSVTAELNNLLNRHEDILPDLPTEGFNASAGLQILF